MMELVLELVAFFGFLCILLNVLLPVVGFVLRFMLVDGPREWRKWQLHRAQQHELRRLQRRVDVLTRRKQALQEQETRRRRVTSAQKRQQTEEHDGEFKERKTESTPRQQRHRLSINSTGKKKVAEIYETPRSRSVNATFASVLNFVSEGHMAVSVCDSVLVLVCGLPAAGKTTLAKHLVASSSTPSRLYERISFDDLYEQVMVEGAGFDPAKWKACQIEMVVRVRKRLDEQQATRADRTQQLILLVDDNFQYRSLRKRFFHLATELNCGFGFLYVNIPAETCHERNTRRSEDDVEGARVPDEVLQRMVASFEPPSGHQNSWEMNTCEINDTNDASAVENLIDTLIQQAQNEMKERHLCQIQRQREEAQQLRDRLATEKSVRHRVDLQLRQWISKQLQDESALSPGMTKAQLASQLNQRRKNYLASMNGITNLVQSKTVEQVVVSLVLQFQQE